MFDEGLNRDSIVTKIVGVLCIIPALAVTVLLFAGVLDYGN